MQIAIARGWRVWSRQHADDQHSSRHGAYDTSGLFPVGHDTSCQTDLMRW